MIAKKEQSLPDDTQHWTRTDNNKKLKSSSHDVINASAVVDTMWESRGIAVQVTMGCY